MPEFTEAEKAGKAPFDDAAILGHETELASDVLDGLAHDLDKLATRPDLWRDIYARKTAALRKAAEQGRH